MYSFRWLEISWNLSIWWWMHAMLLHITYSYLSLNHSWIGSFWSFPSGISQLNFALFTIIIYLFFSNNFIYHQSFYSSHKNKTKSNKIGNRKVFCTKSVLFSMNAVHVQLNGKGIWWFRNVELQRNHYTMDSKHR